MAKSKAGIDPGKASADDLRLLRRAQVVAEARRIVAKDGVEALTFAALESRLGLSRRVATYHFEDKDEIVLAVLESAIDDIRAATMRELDRAAGLPARLATIVRGMTRGFLEHPEATRILLSFWGRMHGDARIRRRNAALFQGFRADTEGLIEGLAPKEVRGFDKEALAALVVGLVIGIAAEALFDPKAIDVEACLDEAEALLAARIAKRR